MDKLECQSMITQIHSGLLKIPNVNGVDYVVVKENGEVWAGVDVQDGISDKEEHDTLNQVNSVVAQIQSEHGVSL